MEVVYRFTFEEGSDDLRNLKLVEKRTEMYRALRDLREKIRSWYKWDERKAIPTEEIRDAFFDILSEHDINFDNF